MAFHRTVWAVILVFSTKPAFAQTPRITSYEKTGNAFTLQWTGTGANPALVQRSTSLLEGSWENVSGLSHSGSFTDWDAPGESAFYRVAMPSALTAIDQLVLSASVAIQQDLQQEIIDGSEAVGSDGDTVFYPNSPADMVPQPAAGVLENDPDFANLVKQSGISFFPGDWGSGANGFSLFATGRKPAARFTNARAGASRFSIRSAMTPTACSPPVRNSSTMRKPLRGLSPRAAPCFPLCNTSPTGAVGTTAPPSAMTKPALIPNR